MPRCRAWRVGRGRCSLPEGHWGAHVGAADVLLGELSGEWIEGACAEDRAVVAGGPPIDARAAPVVIVANPRPSTKREAHDHRCAGAMGFFGGPGAVKDHVVAVPFFVAHEGDSRHCCYCESCARDLLGEEYPPTEFARSG